LGLTASSSCEGQLVARPEGPWPLEELVKAQQMECDGLSHDEIAVALGRSCREIRQKLDPKAPPNRQPFAKVGYQHLKIRR
jgi:hypothetical protein